MRILLSTIFFISVSLVAVGQTNLDFGNKKKTKAIDKRPEYIPQDRDYKGRRLIHWVKNNGRGLLIGNKCMEEVTKHMGFVYLVQTRDRPYKKTEFGRLMHNFFAKTGIFFRNGPFWKFKLKKKRKKCRFETGDFVG